MAKTTRKEEVSFRTPSMVQKSFDLGSLFRVADRPPTGGSFLTTKAFRRHDLSGNWCCFKTLRHSPSCRRMPNRGCPQSGPPALGTPSKFTRRAPSSILVMGGRELVRINLRGSCSTRLTHLRARAIPLDPAARRSRGTLRSRRRIGRRSSPYS